MRKPEYRYWKCVKNGNCTFAPKSRDLSKHGLWVEISREEYYQWYLGSADEQKEATE